ncbi:MAG: zinc-ribbon domain-containing protein [Clostridia bacterium]|nr:zinc-ribbon domain-containing protein [Clostridia bacterium]
MEDKTLNCKDCGAPFTFTVGEQQFYAEKGFTNEPARCPECRKARKENARRNNNFSNNRSSRW